MDDFFTVASVTTLGGSVAGVIAVVGAFRHALGWGPRWFSLLTSIAFAFMALAVTSQLGNNSQTAELGAFRYIIAFVNGCLIYTSAFGIQNNVVAKQAGGFRGATADSELRFRSPW